MKGWLRCKRQGKNRAIRSFARWSLCARATRPKVLKFLAELRCLVLLIRPIDCFQVAARDFDAHEILSRGAEKADSAAKESPPVCRDCSRVRAASGILEMTFLPLRERILPRTDPADGNGLLS